ncbi:glycosyltransferase family 2 protein [Patescibacteria group bacterium]|nr:glycosyltransferase family 2 protein [Patescibacteria group bacterium]
MFLSIIIPAYNEEFRIRKTLIDINEYLSKQKYNYEIIVVNDGSKDKTVEIVKALGSQILNLKLIDNKENKGKGFVVKQGMLLAKGQYRLFADADNSTSIKEVEKMWPYFKQEYDIIIGSRDIQGSVITTPQSWLRKLLGNIFNLIVQIVCGLWGIWDTQCGFKGFSEKAVKDIFPKLTINRWAFDAEVLVLGKKEGYKIKEVPIRWANDLGSKVTLGGMIKMLFEVFKIRLNLIKRTYD